MKIFVTINAVIIALFCTNSILRGYIYYPERKSINASKICNRKSKSPGHFDLEGLHQLTKTFGVKMSRVFTLPVAYFARIFDFRSYVDVTMSLYSIAYYPISTHIMWTQMTLCTVYGSRSFFTCLSE